MPEPMVFPTSGPSFAADPTPTAEVERLEELHTPLADALRDLADLAVSLEADPAVVDRARADVESVTARLREHQLAGAYGIRFNDEGRSWSWGNAVIGVRNALATPLVTHHDEDGMHWAETELGARHSGDEPGVAHPGVAGLLLDHLMGETASGFRKVTMTGTLQVTPHRPVPLGPVRLEARVTSDEGRKVVVDAHLVDLSADGAPSTEGPCVEAWGMFIVPRWAV